MKISSSSSNSTAIIILLSLVFATLSGQCRGGDVPLQVGFYKGKCWTADVEAVVGSVVLAQFMKDRTIAAALLRMQFHDCFVNGCDASILLDGNNTEKTAGPNLSVRSYEVIDAAKAAVEAICPGVVSCADIIVMATRDAVALSGGGRYIVQTGRRDGTISLAKNVDLPAPSISVSDSVKAFAKKGLNATDMVYLLGGHTVGVAHCSLFQDRLYNFQKTGKPYPTMDPSLLTALRARCPQNTTVDNAVNLDQNPLSSMTVDNSYYRQIILHRGILQIDQELALDPLSEPTVTAIAKGFDFSTRFGQAMIKLGTVQVFTGKQGEIRRSCRATNKPHK
ncbi:Peroxidase 60 [Sesamum alatum]|uniref:Peroxidase n=1 Tax=Sesamum alatum TaxID=300844 RepID=A0AAE2CZV0_9LAMI|nr:Peroxidase 60 [Sesamum alatum]